MKKYLLITTLLFLQVISFAQQRIADSLLNVLPHAKEDTNKVLLYIDIGNAYEYEDPNTAGTYYLLAGNLSKKLNYKRGIVKYISNYTGILNVAGKHDSSLLLNKQAVEIAKELNDRLVLAKVYANTGNSFNYLSEYDSAIYYYETAGRYFEEMKNNYLLARMYEMEQLAYQNLSQYKKALQCGKLAVSELRNSGDSIDLSRCLLNLANSYQSNDAPDSALNCYKEALAIAQKTHYLQGESASLLGIGNIYFHRYDADKMKPYFEKALVLSQQIGDMQGEGIASRGMALYYFFKEELDKAKAFCIASIKLVDSSGTKQDKYESLHVLSSILYAQHDIVAAEKIRGEMQLIENEIRGDELQQKEIAIEKKFETEKKEAQIKLQAAQLKQKDTLNYILIGSALALLIISLLSYRNYRHRQKLQQQRITELETEKQLTATEAILKGEEQERSRLAKDLHDGLGGMLSGIKYSLSNMKENLIMTPVNAQSFEHSINMLDNSINEMRRVAHNLMPESLLKFGLDDALKDFCNEINQNGMLNVTYQSFDVSNNLIEQSLSVTVYRIVQELLNNIIKHAAAHKALVQVAASEKQITITVEDDGKGMETDKLKEAKGIGWNNIRSRVQYHKGTISIQSQPDKGTSVFIEFPTV